MPEPTGSAAWAQNSHMHTASEPATESDAFKKINVVSKEGYLPLTSDADTLTPLSKMTIGTIQHCDTFEQKLVQQELLRTMRKDIDRETDH